MNDQPDAGGQQATTGAPQQAPTEPPPLDPYGAPPQQNPYYRPYVKPVRAPYSFVPGDAAYAGFTLALGFLCWEFGLFSNLGAFIVLIAALAGTAFYLRTRGTTQAASETGICDDSPAHLDASVTRQDTTEAGACGDSSTHLNARGTRQAVAETEICDVSSAQLNDSVTRQGVAAGICDVSSAQLGARGVRQSRRGIAVFAVCVLGAMPFLLYDAIPINLFLTAFVLFACFYWVAVSTGNSVEDRVSGFVLTDWANQTFVVPFSNFLAVFVSIKTASKDTKRGKSVLVGVIGLCIAIPLIIGVTTLLINSDAGFEKFANDFSEWIGLGDIGTYLLEFIGGVPIACYIFGAVAGNAQKRYTNSMTKEDAEKKLADAHRIPRVAILTPLAVLCVLYIVYIVVMSVYLFSALAGSLPDEWLIYAEYARRGFFELCGVAAINLFLLIFMYSFAKRMAGEYPKAMRLLTGLLCVMTLLLIATGVSKMILYIDAYGLSRLRIYTFWFLILLFVLFAILAVWHARPFNAGRPIVIMSVLFLLALFLANTDGIVAKYNVWQYENGKIRTVAVDTDMLADMSDAVLPHLAALRDEAENFGLSLAAHEAINKIDARHRYGSGMISEPKDAFRDWSIQSALTNKYLPERPVPAEGNAAGEAYGSVIIGEMRFDKSLIVLDLSHMYLSDEDIAPLREMTDLQVLYLHDNHTKDISPLSGLTNLTWLSLHNNYIADLTPLSGLSNLTRLSLSNNGVSDLGPLSGLTNLTGLYLDRNAIDDLSPLSGLTGLTNMDLSRNKISDIAPLAPLTNLEWLYLAGNRISDIEPLSSLTRLNDLSLSDNRIDDLAPLSGLGNLIWLDADRNEIDDLAPLSGLRNLTYVNLEQNHIEDWSFARNIRNVQGVR